MRPNGRGRVGFESFRVGASLVETGDYGPTVPVVLTTAPGVRRSGHVYDDKTGLAYEFPEGRYERWVVRGERFLYVEPRKGYFGCGVLGEVTDSGTVGRKVVEIAEYKALPRHVGLSAPDGSYYEADPTYWRTGNIYWAQGVRPLSEQRFEAIIGVSVPPASPPSSPAAGGPERSGGGTGEGGYASPAVARAVERYAVDEVLAWLRQDDAGLPVVEMPHNNPGFDIRVGHDPDAPDLYVEVKGTQSVDPVFFMSAGEREFSYKNAAKYEFFVVAGIDLTAKTHVQVHHRRGAMEDDVATMKASQWKGRLLPLVPAP